MEREDSALVAHKSKAPIQQNRTADSTFDRIYKYFHNDKTRIELSDKEKEILERWEKGWLLMCRRRTVKQTCDLLVKLFGITRGVAYEDVRNAMILFSNPNEDLKEAKRLIAETNYLQGADKAWKNNDLEMHKKYTDAYAKINGLDENTIDGTLAEKIKAMKAHTIVITADPQELMKMAKQIQEGIVMDIPHEDVE